MRNINHNLILSSLVLNVYYVTVLCTVRNVFFHEDPALSGNVCVFPAMILQVSPRSKISCSKECDDNLACASFSYNHVTKSCTLCQGETSLEMQEGTMFYLRICKLFIKHMHLLSFLLYRQKIKKNQVVL